MSWGFEFSGTKESVKAQVVEYCDRASKQYAGTEEAVDVDSTRVRVCALVDALKLDDENPSVKAGANGSHSTDSGNPIHAQAQYSVGRCALPPSGA